MWSGRPVDVGWPASGIVVHAAGYLPGIRASSTRVGETFCIAFTRAQPAGHGVRTGRRALRRRLIMTLRGPGRRSRHFAGIQQHPSLLPTAAAVVLLAWEERTGSSHIRAQHVLVHRRRGPALARGGSAVVCAASGAQTYPMIASDLANGLLAAWDRRARWRRGRLRHARARRRNASPGWPRGRRGLCFHRDGQTVSDGRRERRPRRHRRAVGRRPPPASNNAVLPH